MEQENKMNDVNVVEDVVEGDMEGAVEGAVDSVAEGAVEGDMEGVNIFNETDEYLGNSQDDPKIQSARDFYEMANYLLSKVKNSPENSRGGILKIMLKNLLKREKNGEISYDAASNELFLLIKKYEEIDIMADDPNEKIAASSFIGTAVAVGAPIFKKDVVQVVCVIMFVVILFIIIGLMDKDNKEDDNKEIDAKVTSKFNTPMYSKDGVKLW